MKKDELLKQLKEFIAKNPGKILLGTELALQAPSREDDAEEDGVETVEESNDGGEIPMISVMAVGSEVDGRNEYSNMDTENNGPKIARSCSILECDDASSEDFLWCSLCELWFCKDLHGPHNSHSAQTHFKEGLIPKKNEGVSLDEDNFVEEGSKLIPSATDSNSPNIVNVEQPTQLSKFSGQKRRRSELANYFQPTANSDMSKVEVAVRKLKDILAKPSKIQKDQLRSTLNFTSYDIPFLTMVANEFGISISDVVNKSRVSRVEVLDYLLSLLK